ncbi:helix-turn-helix transcriptional regulator [Bacteroides sp.]|jgi:putative transcriptional regulator
MSKRAINRLKAVLTERQLTGKWLADQLGKSVTTVSRWCTNETQSSLEVLAEIADLLEIDMRDLIIPSKTQL